MSDVVPAVSVVVPTYNRRHQLERMLGAIAEQDFDEPFEVVVVSDGSTDSTNEFLQSTKLRVPVRVVLQSNQGPAAARNHGVAVARADLILFVDDDVIADRKLVRTHYEAHRDDGALVSIGPMIAPDDHRMSAWVEWEQAMLDRQYRAMNDGEWDASARQFYTGNAAVRRAHLIDSGGFDTSFRRAEDVELAYRLAGRGLHFRFCPGALGYHYAERSYASWRQAAYAYGRSDVIFARDGGQQWIYPEICDKFAEYHQPVAWTVRTAATHPRLAAALTGAGGRLAPAAYRLRAKLASRVLLSGVYAIEYYRGVADELGSLHTFTALLRGVLV